MTSSKTVARHLRQLEWWAVLLIAAIRLRESRPWLVLLTPVASIGFWAAVLTCGSWVFGWTA